MNEKVKRELETVNKLLERLNSDIRDMARERDNLERIRKNLYKCQNCKALTIESNQSGKEYYCNKQSSDCPYCTDENGKKRLENILYCPEWSEEGGNDDT